tara:strand:- start:4242 stop:5366 length:1125 start_codon:yes stop_codon:yes gene_type:complete
MTIEVHVLGTSSARPTGLRQVSGSLISCHDGVAVVDAGEGFQTRFAKQRKRMKNHETYHLKSSKVSVLCLTHGHLDHTWGVLPWLQSMALDSRIQPLLIIGPTNIDVLDSLLENESLPENTPHSDLAIQYQYWRRLGGISKNLGYRVRWVLGAVGEGRWIEFLDNGEVIELAEMPQPEGWRANRINALPTIHTIPSCAWQLTSSSRKGKFNRMRAAELKLSDDERAKLAAGEDIKHGKKTLLAKDFRGDASNSLSVIISGDTSEMAPGITAVNGCNLLIHEATFLDDYSNHARDYLHSTASGAARTALACQANHLVLTHYGARIKQTDTLLNEAMAELGNSGITLSAAHDGDRIIVDDLGLVTHLQWRGEGWVN